MTRDGRIGLKFCGGCNPEINRKALAEAIQMRLPRPFRLTTEEGDEPWETALLLCGCPTACADRPEIRGAARRWILISGKRVDDEDVSQEKMVERVMTKMEALLRQDR
jgi:hypothetical protein